MYGTSLYARGPGMAASRCVGFLHDSLTDARGVVVLFGDGSLCVASMSQSGTRFLGTHDIPASCAAGWLVDAVERGAFEPVLS
jgi:hypothetical protein